MRNPVPHGFKGFELFDTMFSPTTLGGHSRTPSGASRIPTEPIPVDRAVWFIRVIGANEISAHRSRAQPVSLPVAAPSPVAATPSSTNTTPANPVLPPSSNDWYTQEFTIMFTSWLRVQLTHLSLPSGGKAGAGQAGIPAPKPVAGVLGDEKSRIRWVAKWHYRCVAVRLVNDAELPIQHRSAEGAPYSAVVINPPAMRLAN